MTCNDPNIHSCLITHAISHNKRSSWISTMTDNNTLMTMTTEQRVKKTSILIISFHWHRLTILICAHFNQYHSNYIYIRIQCVIHDCSFNFIYIFVCICCNCSARFRNNCTLSHLEWVIGAKLFAQFFLSAITVCRLYIPWNGTFFRFTQTVCDCVRAIFTHCIH